MLFDTLQSYRQSASFIQVSGHRLAYWCDGEGPVLLLIHGFPSASWDWHSIWPVLRNHYRLVAIDLLGFGLSDKPVNHDYQLTEQAAVIDKIMTELGIRQADVLAHDYGDSVAQQLLYLQQHRQLSFQLNSICFLNGGVFPERHRPLLTQKLLKSPLGPWLSPLLSKTSLHKGMLKIFSKNTPPSQQDIDSLWHLLEYQQGTRVIPAILQYINQRKIHRDKWINAMQQTTVPLAFINGVEDPISGLHMMQRFKQLFPHCFVAELACGHYPQLELPDVVVNCYLQFMASHTQAQASLTLD